MSSSSSTVTTLSSEESSIRHHGPIAIIGYGYRLPGGLENDQDFWDLLASRGYIQEPVAGRYGKGVTPTDGYTESPLSFASPYEGLYRNDRHLEFDCALFGMSIHDALRMDPQIKIMLMCTWEALQCAGLSQSALHNSKTGVFTGIQTSAIAGWRPNYGAKAGDVPGKSGSMIANRISFHFNWMGPSFAVATACSSGITALDAAVKSLDCGECNMAAFGATHFLGLAQSSIGFNVLGIVSKTGSSRSFDKDANGYMRSEGSFIYLLKRLDDAERDGDRIFGVIRGCALNTAGAEDNAELLTQGRMIVAPAMHAQQKLMQQIVTQTGVDPKTVDYLEAHATGTVLGDAIEGNAIANAYGGADRETHLRIASVRSNMGHMEASSFTCSFLKVLLMLQRRQFLPISAHHKEPTDKIPFVAKKMKVQTEVEPFPEDKIVRIGVNSFGFGGANGHCLMEEYHVPERESWSRLPGKLENKVFMAPLSAKSDEALVANARLLAETIDSLEAQKIDMFTLIGNLSVRMTHHRVRTSFTASSLCQLKEKLIGFAERSDIGELKPEDISKVQLPRHNDPSAESGSILVVFPGQGSQWAGCGRELYESELVFRRVVDAIDKHWIELSGVKLSDIAFDPNIGDKLNECCWAQPVTFMVQVAMYELLLSQGIHPKAVIGHSAGETSAAYASGAYTLEEACYLVYHRARLQNTLRGCGRMLVLMLDSSAAEALIEQYGFTGKIEVACRNSNSNTVLCGAEDLIIDLRSKLEADGQPNGSLIPGNIAFHSQHMVPIKDMLQESLSVIHGTEPRGSTIPMISTVTGTRVKNFDVDYWYQNTRQPVDLIAAITAAENNIHPQAIIEISTHITLRSPIRDIYTEAEKPMPNYIYTLVRSANTADTFAQSIGNCFKAGLPLNFSKLYPRPYPMTHLLPHYAMKRERVIDNDLDDKHFEKQEICNAGPLLGSYTSTDHLSFENAFSKKHFLWMADHVVQGQPLVPAAAYLELLFQAFPGKIVHIKSARCLLPYVLTNDPALMYTELTPVYYAPNRYEFKIYSRLHGDQKMDTKIHCLGVLETIAENMIDDTIPPEVHRNIADDNVSNFTEVVYKDRNDFYTTMLARIGQNFSYGPLFQAISKVEFDRKQHRIRFELSIDPDLWKKWDDMGYQFHPSMLDGVLQSFLVYLMESSDFAGVPQFIKNLTFIKKPSSEKLIVIYDPPDYLRKEKFHQKGQLAFSLGERSAGHCSVYDAVSGELICAIGDYTSFGSNTRLTDLRKTKHYLSWQPKDNFQQEVTIVNAVQALTNGADVFAATKSLIQDITTMAHPDKDTPFFLNIAECAVGANPERLAMEDCMSSITNAPVQYTVISKDTNFLTESYQKLGTSNADANVRFTSSDENMSKGFLRQGMLELLIIRLNVALDVAGEPENDIEKELEEYNRLSLLAAPGCIILVESIGKEVPAPSSWKCLWKSPVSESTTTFTIFQAPALPSAKHIPTKHSVSADTTETAQPETDTAALSIVVKDSLGFSDYFESSVRSNTVTDIDFDQAASWERVDYFAMHENNENIDLFDGPSKLTEFVKEACIRRSGVKDAVPCIFTIYTSGAMLTVTSPMQTGIWGATRSISLEVGGTCSIDFRLIDVASKEDLNLAPFCEAMRERELCVHNGRLWTCRLINVRELMPMAEVGADDKDAFRLHTNNSGLISELEFRLEELPPLKPYEIEISVKAAALNFRDIMIGLGKLPLLSFEASMLGRNVGMECSGVVVRCGAEVADHKVGDKVLAMQGGCIANRISCHEKAAYPLPQNLSFEEGSATASVYVTAYYALIHLARMREGQTVLVHSALGGVGQAAIALCKLYGTKVYGTAGSEEKRQILLDMGCVDVFDSHSTKWFPALMASTNGLGVDVVLNSLAGEHLDLCLEALKPGGFHCEIGKVDIFADRNMKMSVFRKNIAFRAIDVDRLMTDDPLLTRELSIACLKLMADGKVPPLPCTVYSYKDYHEALRCMMNGKHRGKLVLTPPGPGETIRAVDNRQLFGKGKDGTPRTILMSGCLGGFGLRVLSYVIALGGRNIVLLDRDLQRKRNVEWVLDYSYVSFLMGKVEGLRIEIVYGDVGVYDHVVDAVASVKSLGMPPIGSVFHLAGILDDKKVEDLDRDSFARVFEPKANGAWNLHRATFDLDTIDHFVMFSSTSSAIGNPGQVNYSAANSYQDGLAAMRLQSGKPAFSYCMGAVIEAGMASRSSQLLQMMAAGGMPAISCIFAIEALDTAIRGRPHWNSVAALAKDLPANYDSTDYLRTFAQLIRNNSAFKMGDSSNLSREALIDVLSERVGKLCGVERLDPTEPFSSYGLNSISVTELATYLKNEMSYTVTAMELMTSATCESIADGIIKASTESADISAQTEDDEETAVTEEESDSSTPSTEDDGHFWTEIVPRQQSLFEPSMQEYFNYAVPQKMKEVVQQDVTPMEKIESIRTKVAVEAVSVPDPLYSLGSLDGNLPPPCQETLNDLKAYINALDISDLAPPVSVKDIKRVLLTGATGFVGRHFVADLLNNQDHHIETIYCPVRASSNSAATERLVIAMEEAGTWKEDFAGRLQVFNGDLTSETFGLSPEAFKDLCGKVDAVYHFASDLNLTSSFNDLRRTNNGSMHSIFKLCLSVRRKPLYLASTLGIFPQYFCQFANEMSDKKVSRDKMPEIALMKRIFPLNGAGYPWTKLINELACYGAMETKGLDLAVFRLPAMATNSKTGYSVNGDPIVRLSFAVLQLRLMPGTLRTNVLEDSAMSNEMMLRISLNPDRKNTIYHCSYISHTIATEAHLYEMMGFPLQKTTYENFKSQCLKMGSNSPLNSYWLLFDRFAPYWYTYKRCANEFPIDISTIEDDCSPMPVRSNSLAVLCKSLEWSQIHDNLPGQDISLVHPSTDLESILAPTRKVCNMYELDFNTVVPPFAIEGLQRICAELHARKHMLPEVAMNLTMRLEGRVHLHRLLQLHPQIREENIQAPVFILGLHRTGTTFLQRMLEASGQFKAPHTDDQLAIPKAELIIHPDEKFAKKRIAAIASFLQGHGFDGIHEIEMGVAEEDMIAHASAFMSLEYDVMFDLPKYRAWVESQQFDEVYEEHRTWMQFIAWWRRRQNPDGPSRWCYKYPWHLRSVKQLLNMYPDARLVHTHRDIKEVASSWCSLVEMQRKRFVDDVDVRQLGYDQMKSLGTTLKAGIEFRQKHPELEEKWIDIHYNQLIVSPLEIAKQIISHAGIELDNETVTRISDFIEETKAKRDKIMLHQPKYENFGITPKDFETQAFQHYKAPNIVVQFLRTRSISLEQLCVVITVVCAIMAVTSSEHTWFLVGLCALLIAMMAKADQK